MAINAVANLKGAVGAALADRTKVTLDPMPRMVAVSIIGTGNARVAINGNLLDATKDSVVAGGSTAYFTEPTGISTIEIYADNSESLTYVIQRVRNTL